MSSKKNWKSPTVVMKGKITDIDKNIFLNQAVNIFF